MASRLHHPSLPAPVVHAAFSVTQSKSHVLAGVQDAYWSDDEAVREQLWSAFSLSDYPSEPLLGRRRVSSLPRGNGHLWSQLQALHMWLPSGPFMIQVCWRRTIFLNNTPSQICRFCWHHIKENLNKRCPACRRVYTDDAVEFKPIATQESALNLVSLFLFDIDYLPRSFAIVVPFTCPLVTNALLNKRSSGTAKGRNLKL